MWREFSRVFLCAFQHKTNSVLSKYATSTACSGDWQILLPLLSAYTYTSLILLTPSHHRRRYRRQDNYKTSNVLRTLHWGTSVQPILRWKSNEFYVFWVCICRIRYSACTAHSPYYHQLPARLYSIFPLLVTGKIFGKKKLLAIKHVLWFFLRIFSATFLILRRNERDMIMDIALWFFLFFFLYFYLFFYFKGAGLLARSQYSEGPATGHLDTGFSWFPCVYKQMLRWFPRFQVATTCFSCSPPDLNLVVTNFIFCIHVK